MSHIRTFDDTLLSEAVTYINVAMKKLKAMEEQTPRSEQAISLLEYAKDEALTEINVRCETRKGKLLGERGDGERRDVRPRLALWKLAWSDITHL